MAATVTIVGDRAKVRFEVVDGKAARRGLTERRAREEAERRARSAERAKAGFTPAEDAELLEVFGGFAARAGVRSLHGATQDRMLRSPPREGVRAAALRALEFAGGSVEREEFVATLAAEAGATPYEARRAVRKLVDGGFARTEVRATWVTRDVDGGRPGVGRDGGIADLLVGVAPRQERYEAPRVWVVQELDEHREPAARRSRVFRWAQRDAELEAFCRGFVGCSGDESPEVSVPEVGSAPPDAAIAALAAMPARDLAAVRLWYEGGTSGGGEARYADVFGGMHARLLPLAPSVEAARLEVVARLLGEREAALEAQRARGAEEVAVAREALSERRGAVAAHREAGAAYEESLRAHRAGARGAALLARGGAQDAPEPSAPPEPPPALPRLPPGRLRAWRAVARAGTPVPDDPGRLRALVDREVRVADALREILDARPATRCACPPGGRGSRCAGCLERDRWQEARRAFVSRVRGELVEVLARAAASYRTARSAVGRVGRGNAPRRPIERFLTVRTWERSECPGCGQTLPGRGYCGGCR
jgi:hypothetical protein